MHCSKFNAKMGKQLTGCPMSHEDVNEIRLSGNVETRKYLSSLSSVKEIESMVAFPKFAGDQGRPPHFNLLKKKLLFTSRIRNHQEDIEEI
jgi:hypothetical protein